MSQRLIYMQHVRPRSCYLEGLSVHAKREQKIDAKVDIVNKYAEDIPVVVARIKDVFR
jgi:uncharacterized alkaline shock family protein YloU